MHGGGVFDAGVSTWGVNQSLIKIEREHKYAKQYHQR